SVTVRGDEIVEHVANEARHDDECKAHLPDAVQMASNVERCGRTVEGSIPFDDDDARRVAARDHDAVLEHERFRDVRLNRGELEKGLAIARGDEAHGRAAEVAHTVEEHDRAHEIHSLYPCH